MRFHDTDWSPSRASDCQPNTCTTTNYPTPLPAANSITATMLATNIPLNTFTGSILPLGTTVGLTNFDNTILTATGTGPILSSIIPTLTQLGLTAGSLTYDVISNPPTIPAATTSLPWS